MSVVLFRTRPQSSLASSCRHWLSQKCLHVFSAQPSSTPNSAAAAASNTNPSAIQALGLTAAQTRRVPKRSKRPEYKPTENLVKKHLLNLRGTALTSEDVEALKPEIVTDPQSLEYEPEYKKALDSLLNAFTWPQLKQYLESINSSPPSKHKKPTAEYILEEKWGWPPLKQVLQDRIDWTEISEQHFAMEPGYSFLLVGKDGTELLTLSKRYNVQMSFTNPRSLKVTGLKGALKQIDGYIESFKTDVQTEEFSLPAAGTVKNLTDRISRMSGAFVMADADSKIFISFLKSQPLAADIARRLILQVTTNENALTCAVHRQEHLEKSNTPGTSPYSLYPFLPPQPLPWQTSSPSVFRYRRVGDWLKTPHPSKTEPSFDDSADNFQTVLLANDSKIDIKSHLLSRLGNTENVPLPVFTVSSGHFLFLSPSNQRATLIPPLIGQVGTDKVLHWTNDPSHPVLFQPSVPSQFLSTPTDEEQNIRRLVYRTIKPAQTGDSVQELNTSGLVTTLTFELPTPESILETDVVRYSPVDLESASCIKSTESNIYLLVPDRTADIKISASALQSLSVSSWPEELTKSALLSRSEKTENATETESGFPLMFTHDGAEFYFHNDAYIHRALKSIALEGTEKTIIIETSVDHETGKSATICKAVCENHSSPTEWNDFLRLCNVLTAPRPKPVALKHSLISYASFRPFSA